MSKFFKNTDKQAPFSSTQQTTQPFKEVGLNEESQDPKAFVADEMVVLVSGVIESGEIDGEESLRIEYAIKTGGNEDWTYIPKNVFSN